jgi:hypothetical protein
MRPMTVEARINKAALRALNRLEPQISYALYLESYNNTPDMDDMILAESREQAVDVFFDKYRQFGWERETIESCVEEVRA